MSPLNTRYSTGSKRSLTSLGSIDWPKKYGEILLNRRRALRWPRSLACCRISDSLLSKRSRLLERETRATRAQSSRQLFRGWMQRHRFQAAFLPASGVTETRPPTRASFVFRGPGIPGLRVEAASWHQRDLLSRVEMLWRNSGRGHTGRAAFLGRLRGTYSFWFNTGIGHLALPCTQAKATAQSGKGKTLVTNLACPGFPAHSSVVLVDEQPSPAQFAILRAMPGEPRLCRSPSLTVCCVALLSQSSMKTYTAIVERCPETKLFVGYIPGLDRK